MYLFDYIIVLIYHHNYISFNYISFIYFCFYFHFVETRQNTVSRVTTITLNSAS